MEGTTGRKDNSETAALRKDKPKPEVVTTIDRDKNKGKAIELAKKQNTMDDGQLAQVPAGKNFPTTTGSGN